MKNRDAQQVLASARHDVELILGLAKEGDAFLRSRTNTPPQSPFTEEESEQLRTVSEVLLNAVDGRVKKGEKVTTHVSENVSALILRITGYVRQRRFFAEMSLVYLVTRLEAFLKDYLTEYLLKDPRRLRSSSTLTYEQALSHSSMAALKRALAEREAEKLGYGTIDEVAQVLERRFSVNLSEFAEWEGIREVVYRRNVLVHNKGEVDDVYRSKTKYKGKEGKLEVNAEYLATASSNLLNFFEFVHAKLSGARDGAI